MVPFASFAVNAFDFLSSMQSQQQLNNITIILVDAKSPANIGAVARSMMNMGLSRLVLVNPLKDRNEEAYKLAAGADRIIQEATIVETLAGAITGQNLVIGTSRHPGRLRKNIRPPREMAGQVVPLLSKNRVAVVFGNEVNGLGNRDLALCHEIIAIPASEAFPSLNLSHAVMIVAYELFLAARTGVSSGDRKLAPAEDLEQFHLHLQETLMGIGFLEQDRPGRIMATLRQIFGRARLDSRDVSILRGILTAVDRACSKGD
ncbi:MAG TPA: RNA methyltransferase [Nitrospirota bacterium]|nr:RNA methyltransferase [Nitrospirota bacterium]